MIKVYDDLEELDRKIKEFCEVCNSFLINKDMYYDESKVTCKLIVKQNDREISFSQLSSGEKQIGSIFLKIYLEDQNNLIVLLDEPELSLSLLWQQ